MTASDLGSYLFKSTNPKRYRWEVQSYNKIDENNIQVASQRVLTMKVKISKLMHFSWSMNQSLITDPKVYSVKNLPQSVLDEIQKAYKEAEKYDKESGHYYDNQGGRKVTPPPL